MLAHVCGGDLDVDGTDVHKNPTQKLGVVVSGDHGSAFINTVGKMKGEGGGGKRIVELEGKLHTQIFEIS
jgi:hypothetical protein